MQYEVAGSYANLVKVLQIRASDPWMCMLFPLSSYYIYILLFVLGWDALAKVKEGQREKFIYFKKIALQLNDNHLYDTPVAIPFKSEPNQCV